MCVSDYVNLREKERLWVYWFPWLYRYRYIFQPEVNEGNHQKPLKVSYLPSSLSSLHNPFIFWSLHHQVSKRTLILQPISYGISAKVSIFPSLLPTHLSIPLYFMLYIFRFRPSTRLVNLLL